MRNRAKRILCSSGATGENIDREFRETDHDLVAGDLKIYNVNKCRFHNCPHVKMHDGGQHITAIVDCGSEVTILTQELFKILASSNKEILQIHVTGAVLISAWGNRTKNN